MNVNGFVLFENMLVYIHTRYIDSPVKKGSIAFQYSVDRVIEAQI